MDTEAIARAYWNSAETRDWDAFAAVLAADVVYEMPQTRERVRGRDAYVRFNREYPGDWHLTVVRVVAGPTSAVTWTAFTVDGRTETGLAILDVGPTGLIERVTDFWPEPYEPPAGRAHLTERF